MSTHGQQKCGFKLSSFTTTHAKISATPGCQC